jgi:hypothetical protein
MFQMIINPIKKHLFYLLSDLSILVFKAAPIAKPIGLNSSRLNASVLALLRQ